MSSPLSWINDKVTQHLARIQLLHDEIEFLQSKISELQSWCAHPNATSTLENAHTGVGYADRYKCPECLCEWVVNLPH